MQHDRFHALIVGTESQCLEASLRNSLSGSLRHRYWSNRSRGRDGKRFVAITSTGNVLLYVRHIVVATKGRYKGHSTIILVTPGLVTHLVVLCHRPSEVLSRPPRYSSHHYSARTKSILFDAAWRNSTPRCRLLSNLVHGGRIVPRQLRHCRIDSAGGDTPSSGTDH